jgi:hypothetical protein
MCSLDYCARESWGSTIICETQLKEITRTAGRLRSRRHPLEDDRLARYVINLAIASESALPAPGSTAFRAWSCVPRR